MTRSVRIRLTRSARPLVAAAMLGVAPLAVACVPGTAEEVSLGNQYAQQVEQ